MKNSFSKNNDSLEKILEEIRIEQKVSPLKDMSEYENTLLSGIYDIEDSVGYYIDFDIDLKARDLLKNYVLFSMHNLKSKFKEDYANEYISLQFKYNRDTDI